MISGLVGSSPPLNKPVLDSKERESKGTGDEFDNLLESKTGNKSDKTQAQKSEKVQGSTRKTAEPERPPSTKTESPQEKPKAVRSESNAGKAQDSEPKKADTESKSQPVVRDSRQNSQVSAQRQRTIRKFMDSFEGEFGIPPQQMVEAMALLKVQDLEKPPEETVDAVISELNLAPQEQGKAKQLYKGLLDQLRQIEVRADLPKSTDNLLSQLMAERLQLSGEKKEFLGKQIQDLNDRFWMKGAYQDLTLNQESNPDEDTSQASWETLRRNIEVSSGQEALPAGDLAITPFKISDSTESLMTQLQKSLKTDGEQTEEGLPLVEDLNLQSVEFIPLSSKSEHPQLRQDSSGQEDKLAAFQPEVQPSLTKAFMNALEETDRELQASERASAVEPKKIQEPQTVDLKSLQLGDLSSLGSQVEFFPLVDTAANKPTQVGFISEQQKTENVQQILSQAQSLIKKGGGEVNVQMTPEGLGSIQMKLQVLDGKVQLFMNTESQEAKKMIESSLQDLKQSLAAHQLSMDHVRVDVVAQASSSHGAQNDLQNQMQNFFEQQQREGTRQFWQQFNENFGNRQARENYFDAQSIRTGIRRQELPGIQESGGSRTARRTGKSGRSLNLVA